MDGQETEKEEVAYLEWKRQSFRKGVNIKNQYQSKGCICQTKKTCICKKATRGTKLTLNKTLEYRPCYRVANTEVEKGRQSVPKHISVKNPPHSMERTRHY